MKRNIARSIRRNPLRLLSILHGRLTGLFYVDQSARTLPILYETPGLGISFKKRKGGRLIINGQLIVEKHGARKPCSDVTIEIYDGATLIINGQVILGAGVHILVGKGASVILGGDPEGTVSISYNTEIIGNQYVEIKSGALFSWDILVMDTNYHTITEPQTENNKPVVFRKDVWVGTRATILKGVEVGEGAIIAAGAVVTRNIPPRCIAAGNPAKVVKENVRWVE